MSIRPTRAGDDGLSPRMTAATWQQRLELARCSQEVVDIARNFVATFTPYELFSLPDACRPSPKLYVEDIPHLAFDLVRHECANAQTAETVQRLARFFAHASARLAQLAALDHVGARAREQGSHSGAL